MITRLPFLCFDLTRSTIGIGNGRSSGRTEMSTYNYNSVFGRTYRTLFRPYRLVRRDVRAALRNIDNRETLDNWERSRVTRRAEAERFTKNRHHETEIPIEVARPTDPFVDTARMNGHKRIRSRVRVLSYY